MVKLIFLISIFLLSYNSHLPTSFDKRFHPQKDKNQARAFYMASQTGNKDVISSKNKQLLKKFGLIHLLTPSGIHLSAILGIFLLFLKRKFHLFLFIGTLCLFISSPHLYSLKRVLYFQIIVFFLKGPKKNQYAFFLTFIFDLISGGYLANPLSFTYSFLFWGCIVFSSSKVTIIKNIFLAQCLATYFFQNGSLNLLSLFINPIFTSLYSSLFPFFSFNYWLIDNQLFNELIYSFHFFFLKTLLIISTHTIPLELKAHPLFFLLPFISFKSKKVLLLSFLLFCHGLNQQSYHPIIQKKLYALPAPSELLSSKGKTLTFFDFKCKKIFTGIYWDYKCKKRPSHFGGPDF